MSLFDAYARYYDLFSNEKDYEAECDFIETRFLEADRALTARDRQMAAIGRVV
jgi:hypothetical protein